MPSANSTDAVVNPERRVRPPARKLVRVCNGPAETGTPPIVAEARLPMPCPTRNRTGLSGMAACVLATRATSSASSDATTARTNEVSRICGASMDRSAAHHDPIGGHRDQHRHTIDEASENRMRCELDDMADADHAEGDLPQTGEHKADRHRNAGQG